jgi:thymidylate synthase
MFPAVSVSSTTFGEAWGQLLDMLLVASPVSPRGIPTQELLAVQVHVDDFLNNILLSAERDLNYRFMVAEWLWILYGRRDLKTLLRYNSVYAQFSDDGHILAGAYGPHIVRQQVYVIDKLREDSDSRQAVMTIWTPNPRPSKDIPCTISLQFLIREGIMHVIVNMRSSDIWLGLPYDFFTFSMMANHLLVALDGVQPGSMTINLGSSHMYLKDVPKSYGIRKVETLRSPKLKDSPPQEVLSVLEGIEENEILGDQSQWQLYAEILQHPKSEALGILRRLTDL